MAVGKHDIDPFKSISQTDHPFPCHFGRSGADIEIIGYIKLAGARIQSTPKADDTGPEILIPQRTRKFQPNTTIFLELMAKAILDRSTRRKTVFFWMCQFAFVADILQSKQLS
jgi:hypothetical protein